MKLWLGYLHNLAKTDSNPEDPYIINNYSSYWYTLGEWCAPGKPDDPNHPMIHTCYYYMNSLLMSKIAAIVGEKEDAVKFAALADTIKDALNKKFFNSDTNIYGSDTTYQTYQILVLASDLIPEGHRAKVLQTLKDDIVKTHQGHLNTGIIGNKYMWPVLTHNGLNDVAYSMVTQTTFPGYGDWIKKGATTLRERWDGKSSQNHQMFGSVDEYFYKYLAGIWSPTDGETSRGYKHIHIQPYIPEGLKSAEASINTITGTISSNWKQDAGQLQLKVVIPANSDAAIAIPLLNFKNLIVKEKNKRVWENSAFVSGDEGVTNGRVDNGLLTFTVGSGTYEFLLSGK